MSDNDHQRAFTKSSYFVDLRRISVYIKLTMLCSSLRPLYTSPVFYRSRPNWRTATLMGSQGWSVN